MKAAVLFDFFGPYHRARLNAAGTLGQVHGIEVFGSNVQYPWSRIDGQRRFEHHNLFPEGNRQSVRSAAVRRELRTVLALIQPDVVFLPGWSDPWSFAALEWCVASGVPAVMMSESTAGDERRRAWKEWIKRRVVALCSAALAGGTPHREYLQSLGMEAERIYPGYDAVDNAHFAAGAVRAKERRADAQATLGVEGDFFLASSRFVPKKNLFRLLDAYAGYRQTSDAPPWKLVLLGGGDLQIEIENRCAQPDLSGHVLLPGFRGYDDLPAYYGLARAFILASTSEQWGLVVNEAMAAGLPVLVSERCGCAADLVKSDRNGHVFDPFDVPGLTHALRQMSAANNLTEMGDESRRIIDDWSPEHFGQNLWRAAATAGRVGPVRPGVLDLALIKFMVRRP